MASAINGGRELSPSSALCGGLPERAKVAVKSDYWLTGLPRAHREVKSEDTDR